MLQFVGRPNNTHDLVCASMQSSFNNQGQSQIIVAWESLTHLKEKKVSSFDGDLYIKR